MGTYDDLIASWSSSFPQRFTDIKFSLVSIFVFVPYFPSPWFHKDSLFQGCHEYWPHSPPHFPCLLPPYPSSLLPVSHLLCCHILIIWCSRRRFTICGGEKMWCLSDESILFCSLWWSLITSISQKNDIISLFFRTKKAPLCIETTFALSIHLLMDEICLWKESVR